MSRKLILLPIFALIGATALAWPVSANQVVFSDDFSGYTATACPSYADGDSFGRWQVVFTGFGCVRILNDNGNHVLEMQPQSVTNPADTSAPLVVGPSFEAPFTYSGQIATTAQLRQNSAPNDWETAWIVWNYTDNQHFYYFIPKENGWELGKEDPAYPGAQRFLATSTTPTFSLTDIKNFEVTQIGATMTISINGNKIVDFTDNERPYTSGRIGLYSEDARFIADNIVVTKPAASPATPSPTVPTGSSASEVNIATSGDNSSPQSSESQTLAATGQSSLITGATTLLLLGIGVLQIHKQRT